MRVRLYLNYFFSTVVINYIVLFLTLNIYIYIYEIQGHSTIPQKKGVQYLPIFEPLIYYAFDLVCLCNFKGFWIPIKQVLYINKNLKHSSRFSAFSLVSHLLLYLSTSFAHCPICLSKKNPQIRQLIPHLWCTHKTVKAQRTHNLKLEALLLSQSTCWRCSLAYSLPIHIQISNVFFFFFFTCGP